LLPIEGEKEIIYFENPAPKKRSEGKMTKNGRYY
jgi:hypothetical protein